MGDRMKNKILAIVWIAFVMFVPCVTSTAILFWGLRLNDREIVSYYIPYFVVVARFWGFAMYQVKHWNC